MSLLSRVEQTASISNVLVLSVLVRVALVLYSEWHDARSVVKYTDVDYRVFTDAANFVLHPSSSNLADGPLARRLGLNIGDPYTRETYRYTPLLAVLLTPNEWLHPSFGKYLFSLCDILAGALIYRILTTTTRSSDTKAAKSQNNARSRAALLCAAHLLNPMVFAISTRGSSEAILLLLVLSTLSCALSRRWDAAAILLGLSTHWKIYPVIYGVACLGVISEDHGYARRSFVKTLVNRHTMRFALISAGTFFALGAAMYAIWGYPFVYESYLYHIHRLDHRHNFSPYFYQTYISYPNATAEPLELSVLQTVLRSSLVSFVPQMTLSLGAGLLFGRHKDDLAFAWFIQTAAFVTFNKVCTSQYFLWYLLFLPLLIPRLHMSWRRAALCLGVWVGIQALWLSEAYKLEFLGESVFLSLWLRGLVYVVGNCWVLGQLMAAYANTPPSSPDM